jgi:hypothetical protein
LEIQEQIYAQKDFFKLLNITNYQWRYHRERLLEHLGMFFDFTIFKGNNNANFFNVTFIRNPDYFPLPKKSVDIKNHYWQETKKIIKEEPCNTGANIARNIMRNGDTIYEHQERTVYGYVLPMLKDTTRVQVNSKVWCKRSEDGYHWIELTASELTTLKSFFDNYFNANDTLDSIADIDRQFKDNEISAQERDSFIGNVQYKCYLDGLTAFIALYGYEPKRIPKYELNAFGCDKPFTE